MTQRKMAICQAIEFKNHGLIEKFAIKRHIAEDGRYWWVLLLVLKDADSQMLHTARGILKLYNSVDTVLHDIQRICAGDKVHSLIFEPIVR